MKRYLKEFELTEEMVKKSIYNCLNHKRWKRRDTSYMFAEYYMETNPSKESKHEVAKYLRTMAYKNKKELYPLVDFISKEIFKEIKNRQVSLPPIMYQKRRDHSNGKIREIGISSMKQQLYDYIVVDCCMDVFMAKIGTYQCASIKGRGQIYGKNAIEKWLRKNPKKSKWVVQCDVKKYYPSVDREVLKRFLKRDIANDDVLYMLFTLIDSYRGGLCIGSYLSQFLANYLLSYAYHYLDEHCFKIRRGKRKNLIWKKLFYMDDMLLIGSDKRDVKLGLDILEEYLNEELNLSLKDSYVLHSIENFPIDMMGFKMNSSTTTVRKRIFGRADKLYKKHKNPKSIMTEKEARRCTSYYGYFLHSDSEHYIEKMKVVRTVARAKEVIRNANNQYAAVT